MPASLRPEHERTQPARRQSAPQGPVAEGGAEPHPLLTLQRQVGNAQIARMLAQREAAPEEEEMVQREAAPEEEEMVQREAAPEEAPEEEDEGALMQASPEVGLEGGPVSAGVADAINARRGSGAPLSSDMRSEMEGAFATSFEDVRVHSDSESHSLNQSVSARAFTTGSDIFLGRGASDGDRSLMAHELTHVVQQRSMDTSGPMTVGPAGDSFEQQADATAAAISSGAAATAQRQEDETA